jgi:hypothetical protein
LPAHRIDAGISPEPKPSASAVGRRFGIAGFAALSILLCSGATAPISCSAGPTGPSGGEVAGAAVGVGAVIAVVVVVAVKSGHHSLSGCVIAGPNGPELQASDSKRYALEGDPSDIKVGDRVKIHGSRVKKTRDTTGDQVYRVEKLKKDYGPCPVSGSSASHPAP